MLTSDDVPGDIFVHFTHIAGDGPAGDGPAGDGPAGDRPAGDGPAGDGLDGDGYLTLVAGERVQFEWEHYPSGQDGCYYRATRVVQGVR